MNFCIALLIAFCFSSADDHCGNFPAKDFDGPGMAKFTGRYSNFVYGYAVKIPKELTAYNNPPPSPQHGFGIVVSWEPRAYIYFDGSYNAGDAKNGEEIEQTYLKWLGEESAQILSIQKYKSRLGRLSARRYVAKHTCKKLQSIFVEDMTIVLYKGVVYSAGLLTTEDRYLRDKVVLEHMLAGWRLIRRE